MLTTLTEFVARVREARRYRREAPARLRATEEALAALAAEAEAAMRRILVRREHDRAIPTFVIASAHDDDGTAVDSETDPDDEAPVS